MNRFILTYVMWLTTCLSATSQNLEWRKDGAVVPDGATLEYQIEMEEAVPGVLYRYAAATGALEPDLALYNNTGAPLDVSVSLVSDDATGEGLQCCFGGQCMPFSSNTMTKYYKLSTECGDMAHRLQLDYYSGMAPNAESAQKLADRTVTVRATAGGETHSITVKFVSDLTASVYDDGDFIYSYNKNGNTANIQKCKKDLIDKIELPTTVVINNKTHNIIGIGNYAFEYCNNITEITLPKYCNNIGVSAFQGCSKLKTITIFADAECEQYPAAGNIGNNAFADCHNLESVVILSAYTPFISTNAFPNNNKLTFYVPDVDNYSYIGHNIRSLAYQNDETIYNGRIPKVNISFAPGCKATYTENIIEKNAGTYILPAKVTHETGYEANCTIKYTIKKKELNIFANNATREYGDTNPLFTISYVGFVDGENENNINKKPTIGTTANKASCVGTYPIIPSNAQDSNYEFTYTNGILTITKASLTVSINNYTKQYGDKNPHFALTYSGFKNNDTETNAITKIPIVATEATASSPIGVYPITVSGGEAENYEFQYYISGTLTISKAPLTIIPDNIGKTYFEDNPTFTFKAIGLKNQDNTTTALTKQPVLKSIATRESKCGEYDIYADGAESNNYTISYDTGKLYISKRNLNVYTGDYRRQYKENNPDFTIKYDGFVNNENEKTLYKEPKAICSATKESDTGIYPIVLSGGEAQNYNLSYINGNLVVDKAEQTLEWEQDLSSQNVGDQVLLTAKATSGLAVEYIIADNNFVSLYKIDNDSYLDCYAKGELQVRAMQSGSNNYYSTARMSKQLIVNAISNITTTSDTQTTIGIQKNKIIVYNKPNGVVVNVYAPNGVIVYSGLESIIDITPGLYIVKVGNIHKQVHIN